VDEGSPLDGVQTGEAEQAICQPWPECEIDDSTLPLCNSTNCTTSSPCTKPCKTTGGIEKTCGTYSTSSTRCQSCGSYCGASQLCSKSCLNGYTLTTCSGAGRTCSSSCSVVCNASKACSTSCYEGSTKTTCGGADEACWDQTVDPDKDGIANSLENQLMLAFAPEFHHDAWEWHEPSSVEWFLSRVEMRFHHDNCSDCQIQDVGQVTSTSTTQQLHQYKDGWFCSHSGSTVSSTASSHYFLDIPEDDTETTVLAGNLASAKCYAHVSQSFVPGAEYDVQYWVFYPYSSAHEGDWEHITVSVKSDGTFHSAYFAAHELEGVRSFSPDFVPATNHVIAYTALGSHANYPESGITVRYDGSEDVHRGGGFVLRCGAANTVNVGERSHPATGQAWLRYAGHWGDLDGIGSAGTESGPLTPSHQDYWLPANQH
jgi:hypothetical protein